MDDNLRLEGFGLWRAVVDFRLFNNVLESIVSEEMKIKNV